MAGLILWRERYPEDADLGNQHHQISQSSGVTVPTVSLQGPAPLLPRVIFSPQRLYARFSGLGQHRAKSIIGNINKIRVIWSARQELGAASAKRSPTALSQHPLVWRHHHGLWASGLATTGMPTGNGRPVKDYYQGLELASARPPPGRQKSLNNAAAEIILRDIFPERLTGSYLERDYEPGPLTGFPNSQGRDAGSCHWKGIQSPKSWSYNLNVSPPGEILSRKNILNCLEFRLD